MITIPFCGLNIHIHTQSWAVYKYICVSINVFINTLSYLYLCRVFKYFLVFLNTLNGEK